MLSACAMLEQDGNSPLHEAAKQNATRAAGRGEAMELLLAAKATVEAKCKVSAVCLRDLGR